MVQNVLYHIFMTYFCTNECMCYGYNVKNPQSKTEIFEIHIEKQTNGTNIMFEFLFFFSNSLMAVILSRIQFSLTMVENEL